MAAALAILAAILQMFGPAISAKIKECLDARAKKALAKLSAAGKLEGKTHDEIRDLIFDQVEADMPKKAFGRRAAIRRAKRTAQEKNLSIDNVPELTEGEREEVMMTELATARSPREQEIIDKVGKFVENTFSGDYEQAFKTHDVDGDGKLSLDEVTVILAESRIGFRATRWAIAEGIIEQMDLDKDGLVSFEEFQQLTGR